MWDCEGERNVYDLPVELTIRLSLSVALVEEMAMG